jgi:RNA polymerase sigma factor (sigma-70 family)
MHLSAIVRRNDVPSRDEASVVAAATGGDTDAFSILAANCRTKVLKRVRQITGNLDDAEDVTQQALMKAFISIRSFRGICSFSTWLTRIAINEALMLKRKSRAHTEMGWTGSSDNDPGVVPEITDGRSNPEQCYDQQERHQIVTAALKTLSPASRLALEICHLNGHSLKDLAFIQGSSMCAAKSRLFRSRSLLRAKVNRSLRIKAVGRARQSDQFA